MRFPRELTTVTSLSKTIAFILFITLPIVMFFVGMNYQSSQTPYYTNVSYISPKPSISVEKNLVVTKWQELTTNSDTTAPVRFSLEYPDGWKTDTLSIEGGHSIIINPTGKITSADLSINPFIIEDYNSEDTLSQIVKQYYCHEKNSPCPDEKNALPLQIDGLPAYKLVPYGAINSVSMVVKKGTSIVVFIANLGERNKSRYSDHELLRIFDHMGSTFHFVDEVQKTVSTLKICPEKWYDNQMPCLRDEGTNSCGERQYFILDGKRREYDEFDIDWVKQNCSITPNKVY